MRTYGCDCIKLKCQDSLKIVRNGTRLQLKTLDETKIMEFTIKYSLSRMTTEQLNKSELLTPCTVLPLSVL